MHVNPHEIRYADAGHFERAPVNISYTNRYANKIEYTVGSIVEQNNVDGHNTTKYYKIENLQYHQNGVIMCVLTPMEKHSAYGWKAKYKPFQNHMQSVTEDLGWLDIVLQSNIQKMHESQTEVHAEQRRHKPKKSWLSMRTDVGANPYII